MDRYENICKDLVDTYEKDIAFLFVFEEMGELSQAISKFLRKRETASEEEKKQLISHISEEIADVDICLGTLQYIFDSWEDVKKWKELKIERSEERVKQKKLHSKKN